MTPRQITYSANRTRDVNSCGCCGRRLPTSIAQWCVECVSHLLPMEPGRAPWDRTWMAQTGQPCIHSRHRERMQTPAPALAVIQPPGPGKAIRLVSLNPLTFDVIDAPTPPEPRPPDVRPHVMTVAREIGDVLSVLERTRARWTTDEYAMVSRLDGWRELLLTIAQRLDATAQVPVPPEPR